MQQLTVEYFLSGAVAMLLGVSSWWLKNWIEETKKKIDELKSDVSDLNTELSALRATCEERRHK